MRSISQLSDYSSCSMAYYLKRRTDAVEKPVAWLPGGTAFHLAMESWARSDRTMTVAQAIKIFEDDYDRQIDELKAQTPDPRDWITDGNRRTETSIAQRRENGRVQVRTAIAGLNDSPFSVWCLPDDSPAIEMPFTITLGGVEVTGKIDVVLEHPNGAVVPLDYKSGAVKEDAVQLGVYAEALRRMFGVHVTHGLYWSGKAENKTGIIAGFTQPIDLSRYTVAYLESLFVPLDKGIRQEIWLPNTNGPCRICGVRNFCPALGDKTATPREKESK